MKELNVGDFWLDDQSSLVFICGKTKNPKDSTYRLSSGLTLEFPYIGRVFEERYSFFSSSLCFYNELGERKDKTDSGQLLRFKYNVNKEYTDYDRLMLMQWFNNFGFTDFNICTENDLLHPVLYDEDKIYFFSSIINASMKGVSVFSKNMADFNLSHSYGTAPRYNLKDAKVGQIYKTVSGDLFVITDLFKNYVVGKSLTLPIVKFMDFSIDTGQPYCGGDHSLSIALLIHS